MNGSGSYQTVLLVAGVAVGLAVSRVDSIPGLAERRRGSTGQGELRRIALGHHRGVNAHLRRSCLYDHARRPPAGERPAVPTRDPHVRPVGHHEGLPSGCSSPRSGTRSSSSLSRVRRPAQMSSVSLSRSEFCLCWRAWCVFVVYVTATMRLLQVSWVVTAVADETRRAISTNRPVGGRLSLGRGAADGSDPRLVRLHEAGDGRHERQIWCDSGDRPRAAGPAGPAVRVRAAVPAEGGRVSPARRGDRGGSRWERSRPRTPCAAACTSVALGRCIRIRCSGSASSSMLPVRPCHRRSTSRPRPSSSSTGWKSCCCGSADGPQPTGFFVDADDVVRLMHAGAHLGRDRRSGVHRDRHLRGRSRPRSPDG